MERFGYESVRDAARSQSRLAHGGEAARNALLAASQEMGNRAGELLTWALGRDVKVASATAFRPDGEYEEVATVDRVVCQLPADALQPQEVVTLREAGVGVSDFTRDANEWNVGGDGHYALSIPAALFEAHAEQVAVDAANAAARVDTDAEGVREEVVEAVPVALDGMEAAH